MFFELNKNDKEQIPNHKFIKVHVQMWDFIIMKDFNTSHNLARFYVGLICKMSTHYIKILKFVGEKACKDIVN